MSDWRDGYDVWKLATPPEYDITPEQEAEIDARYAERQVYDWLASWSDDFNSDEWLSAALPHVGMTGSDEQVAA